METLLDVSTPTQMFIDVDWPQGVPHPAVGDSVILRKQDQAWVFSVLKRHIQIGVDPRTGDPQARVGLTVDVEPPLGFQP